MYRGRWLQRNIFFFFCFFWHSTMILGSLPQIISILMVAKYALKKARSTGRNKCSVRDKITSSIIAVSHGRPAGRLIE